MNFFKNNEILLPFQNVILEKTKPVVYYWPSARGWVRQDSSETQKTEKPTFTVFQALLTSITASFPHASPVGGLQHQLCFHQQILWVLPSKRARIHPLLTLRQYHCGLATSPFHLAALDHDTSLLLLPPLQSVPTQGSLSPPTSHLNSLPLPAGLPMVPQTDRHFLPQGLCTCSACYLESFPTRYPPWGSSPPTVHCPVFPHKEAFPRPSIFPCLFFCIVLTHLIFTFTYLWSVLPPPNAGSMGQAGLLLSQHQEPRITVGVPKYLSK